MSTVIRIDNLYKEYRLGLISHGTLTRDLQSWWARLRGLEDPNSLIPVIEGQKQIEGDRFWALRDLSLDVKVSDIIGIIGGNGAGKSTLLKILSRVTAPTKGTINIRGRIASLLEVGTGFHPELTGRENVFMNGSILGMSKQEIKSKLDEIVDFSGIEEFIDTPVKRYSSGMRVRLGFAVAAHLEPEILIVDEVLAVGDAAFQKRCLGKMEDISRQGRTILFVSHNMNAISSLCTRGVLLEDGMVTVDGATTDAVLSYQNSIQQIRQEQSFVSGNEQCRFIEADITNCDGETVREARLEDELRVCMTYEILKNTEDRCVPNLHILTSSGQQVCCVNCPDVVPMKLGQYMVECLIPGHLLNEGVYNIGVAVTSYHDSEGRYTVDFFENNYLSINIVDSKQPDRWNYGFTASVPGAIRPRFTWSMREVG